MNFLDRALPLIGRNFSIIPLGANSKAPQKGIGAKQRSTGNKGFQQIESWAQRFPDANVGLVADERFCILESDDYARLAELIRNGTGEEIPETMRSGRDPNRPHLIFRHSNKSRTIGCPALPGIFECRFTNQYVVAPGSEVDGTLYKIFVDVPPVEIPDWLVAELVRLAFALTIGEPKPFSDDEIRRVAASLWQPFVIEKTWIDAQERARRAGALDDLR